MKNKNQKENWEWEEELNQGWFFFKEDLDWLEKYFIPKLLKSEKTKDRQKFVDALIWCSGSDDFQVGGKARKGWEKICLPLLRDEKQKKN